MDTTKLSIFKQRVFENEYYANIINNKLLNEEEVYRCSILLPLLKCGEKFYIDELNLMLNIREVIRTSDGNVIYFIDNKYIDTDNSRKQKERVENKIKANILQHEKIQKELKEEHLLSIYNKKCLLYRLCVNYDKFKEKQL